MSVCAPAHPAGLSLSQALRSYFYLLVVDTQKHYFFVEGAVQRWVNMVTMGAEAPSTVIGGPGCGEGAHLQA